MNDNLQAEVVFSFIVQWLLEAAKKSKYVPWIKAETGTINKLISAFLATLYSAGMTFSLTHVGPGHWTLDMAGITPINIAHFLGHGIRVYALTKGWFKVLNLHNGSTLVPASATPNP